MLLERIASPIDTIPCARVGGSGTTDGSPLAGRIGGVALIAQGAQTQHAHASPASSTRPPLPRPNSIETPTSLEFFALSSVSGLPRSDRSAGQAQCFSPSTSHETMIVLTKARSSDR